MMVRRSTPRPCKYNFQRMLRKNLGVAWMFATVMDEDSIEVVDPTTLKINLLKPFAPYDAVLPWLFVANPDDRAGARRRWR